MCFVPHIVMNFITLTLKLPGEGQILAYGSHKKRKCVFEYECKFCILKLKSCFTYLKPCFLDLYHFLVKMDPEKWQNKAHIKIKQYLQSKISENNSLNQGIIQRELESINLSAANGTFVIKGEVESNSLTTQTDEPKLNY